MVKVLIVEDESIIAADLEDCLLDLGYVVTAIASSGEDAIAQAAATHPDLVLMDIQLRGKMDGIQAAEHIWTRLHIPIIYSTGHSDKATLERAKATAPFGYVLKPVEERELYVAIETAMERFRLDTQLQKRERWLTTILRSIGDGIIVVDLQGTVRFLNLVAQALIDCDEATALGQPLTSLLKLVDERTRSPLPDAVQLVLQTHTPIHLPNYALLVTPTQRTAPVAGSAAAFQDEAGMMTGVVLMLRDLTAQRLAAERNLAVARARELEVQLGELQHLNEQRDEFLNAVAHELRTPLANIKMAIQMLEITLNHAGVYSARDEKDPNRAINHYMDTLRIQCNQELDLVNDLLDLQRINSDAYLLDFTAIRLQDWLPHIVEGFEQQAASRTLQLQINIPPDLPPLISDAPSLIRILSELLTNACKYTPPGECITVAADCQPLNWLELQVNNSGSEIPAECLPRLFDQFYRVPNGDSWNQGGTGLGLSLVKKFVNYLGGSIQVNSSSKGTSFIVKLPLNPTELTEGKG